MSHTNVNAHVRNESTKQNNEVDSNKGNTHRTAPLRSKEEEKKSTFTNAYRQHNELFSNSKKGIGKTNGDSSLDFSLGGVQSMAAQRRRPTLYNTEKQLGREAQTHTSTTATQKNEAHSSWHLQKRFERSHSMSGRRFIGSECMLKGRGRGTLS